MRRALLGIPLALLALVALLLIAIVLMPSRWLADRLESVLAAVSGYTVSIGKLELELLTLHPTVRLLDVDVDGEELPNLVEHADLVATIGLLPLFRGQLLLERAELANASVLAHREASGANTWTGAPIDKASEAKEDGAPIEIPAIESLSIENVTVRLDDAFGNHQATLRPTASGSTTDADEPLSVRVDGTFDGEDTLARLVLPSLAVGQTLDAGVDLRLDAALGRIELTLEGTVGDPRSVQDAALDATLHADDLTALETVLGRELPALAPLDLEAALRSEGGTLTLAPFSLSARGVTARGEARLDRDATPPLVQASLLVPTMDVDALMALLEVGASEAVEDELAVATDGPAGSADPNVPANRREMTIERLFGTVHGTITVEVEEIVAKTLPLDTLDARVMVDAASFTATLAADVEGAAASVSLVLSPLEIDPDTGLDIDLKAAIDGVSVALDGSVGDPVALRDIDLETVIDIDDLAAVEVLLARELPELAPSEFTASVLDDGRELLVRRFDLSAPGIVAEGDLRIDPDTTPPTLYANVIAPRMDVNALRVAFGLEEEIIEAAAEEIGEAVDEAVAEAEDTPSAPRLFSDDPLPFELVFDTVQGALQLRVDEIDSASLALDGFDVRIELDPAKATLLLNEIRLARGSVKGSVALEPRQGTVRLADDVVAVAANVELALADIDVTRLMREAGMSEEAAKAGGRLGANVKLWGEGASVAALAGGLDGGALALMSGGTVNDVLVELAGIDLFQSLGDVLVPGEEEVPIRCAYMDLQSENGLLRLDRLVLDTEDTVFLAEGTVNLGTEAMELALQPHPKDPSLLAASTGVMIGGSLAAPEIGVDSSLPARAAAVVVLSQIAAPALALLPLLEIGGGEDSPYCTGLGGALD